MVFLRLIFWGLLSSNLGIFTKLGTFLAVMPLSLYTSRRFLSALSLSWISLGVKSKVLTTSQHQLPDTEVRPRGSYDDSSCLSDPTQDQLKNHPEQQPLGTLEQIKFGSIPLSLGYL